jgi:hypothetical protein
MRLAFVSVDEFGLPPKQRLIITQGEPHVGPSANPAGAQAGVAELDADCGNML